MAQTRAPDARPHGPPACGRLVPRPRRPSCLGGSASGMAACRPASGDAGHPPQLWLLLHAAAFSVNCPGDPRQTPGAWQPPAHSLSLAGSRESGQKWMAPLGRPFWSFNPGPPLGLQEGDCHSGVQEREREHTRLFTARQAALWKRCYLMRRAAQLCGDPRGARPGAAQVEGSKAWVLTKPRKHARILARDIPDEHGSDPKPGLVFQSEILPTANFGLQRTDCRSASLRSLGRG